MILVSEILEQVDSIECDKAADIFYRKVSNNINNIKGLLSIQDDLKCFNRYLAKAKVFNKTLRDFNGNGLCERRIYNSINDELSSMVIECGFSLYDIRNRIFCAYTSYREEPCSTTNRVNVI